MRSNALMDPEDVSSNRAGEITRAQTELLKNKVGVTPTWLTCGVMALLFLAVTVVAGATLAKSTPLAIGATVGVIVVSFAITSVIGGWIAEGRMGHLTVEPAPGDVVWEGGQYVARSDKLKLEPITGGLSLQPGDYTFYIVHGTRWLLSAEPSGAAHQPNAPLDLDALKALIEKPIDFDPGQAPERAAERLRQLEQAAAQFRNLDPSHLTGVDRDTLVPLLRTMGQQASTLMAGQHDRMGMLALAQSMEQAEQPPLDEHGRAEVNRALEESVGADPATLDTNRQGGLTGAQRAGLLGEVRSNLWGALLALGIGAVLVYLAFGKKDFTLMLAVGGFLLLIEAMLVSQVRNELSDWAGGRVRMEEGLVVKYTRTTHGRSSYTHYYFQVNKVRIAVNRRTYDALLPGRSYRVYFTPATKTLVNVELP